MNSASPQECTPSTRWSALLVLIRFVLTLSFANLIDVLHYLPELLHFVVMLAGTGNIAVRMTTYCLLINTVHSLYCTLNPEHGPLHPLIDKITEFGEPQFRLLFGIAKTPGQKINPFQDVKDLRPEDRVSARLIFFYPFITPSFSSLCTPPLRTHKHTHTLSLFFSLAFKFSSNMS
jgi:hypothetical protein